VRRQHHVAAGEQVRVEPPLFLPNTGGRGGGTRLCPHGRAAGGTAVAPPPAVRRRRIPAAGAASSTTPPRAMLTSVAVGFISASSAAPIRWCDSALYGTTSTRGWASRSSASRET